jgi:xanthine/CO dehydrogenase XdhC/CoxF family maturation factor
VEAEVRVRALKMIDQPEPITPPETDPRCDEVADPERAAHPSPSAHSSREASSTVHQFKLNHDFGWDDGLLCGGIMDIAIRILRSHEDVRPLIEMRETLKRRENAYYRMNTTDEQGAARAFEIEFIPSPAMLLVGAGHVGAALGSLATSIGFELTVIDDREDALTPARFPGAKRIVGDIERELRSYRVDAQTYIVLVTRGHRHDAAALAAVVNSPAKYIGMIGSKRKVRTVLDELEKSGVAREKLMRVRAPIGLEIGAVTPAEIAVSIASQLIAVRRGVDDRQVASMKMKDADLVTFFERDRITARP